MKILIDIDGIVTDTLPTWLKKIEEQTGKRATVADITQWDISKCGELASVVAQKIWDILEQPGFYYNLPFIDGAEKALKYLNSKHEIYLVTARMGHHGYSESHRWLEDKLPFLKKEQLIFCPKKELIPADIIIDDKAETLGKYWMLHENSVYMAIEYPYNKPLHNPRHTVAKHPKKAGVTPWSRLVKLIEKVDKPEVRSQYRRAKNEVMMQAAVQGAKNKGEI